MFALVESGTQWVLKDIDFRSEYAAKEKVNAFQKKSPDAKEAAHVSANEPSRRRDAKP